jgi:hypothetical protein
MPQNSPQQPKRRPRPISRFKRSEATRLLQGVLDAGVPVRGVEVDHVTGDLRVLVGKPDEAGVEQVKDLNR